jgi:PTH1 family peptidyl-tRNA hydrolase
MEGGWLIVGLGNPGPEYEWTPHNAGFLALDRLAARHSIRISRPECQSQVGVGAWKSQRLVLAKPQTYMNVCGPAVEQLLTKYELSPRNLIVVYDELALPWGHLRIRPRGSAGGHNGVKSIIAAVRTEDFIRVRLGINPGNAETGAAVPLGDKAKHYVLAPLAKSLRTQLDLWLDEASSAVEAIITEGVEKAMAAHNRRAPGQKEEEA